MRIEIGHTCRMPGVASPFPDGEFDQFPCPCHRAPQFQGSVAGGIESLGFETGSKVFSEPSPRGTRGRRKEQRSRKAP